MEMEHQLFPLVAVILIYIIIYKQAHGQIKLPFLISSEEWGWELKIKNLI